MRLRARIIVYLALFLFLIFFSNEIATYMIIQPSIKNSENHEIDLSVNQAISTLNYQLSDLQGKVQDYATWDDTYNFAQTGNQTFIENNLGDTAFTTESVNLIAIVNNNNNIIYVQSYDFNNSSKVQTSQEARTVLSSDNAIWNFSSAENPISGIILVDNQPMLFATAPILTSLGQGPSMGGMLFGKYVDSQEINNLDSIMNLNFSLTTVFEQKVENNIVQPLLSNKQTVVVEENSLQGTASGYTLINDINSNPTFILQVTQDNTAYQQEESAGNIFQAVQLTLTICFGAALLLLLERKLIKPLTDLTKYVEEISLHTNESVPKSLAHASQELVVLSNAIRDSVKKKLEGMNEVSRMVGHDLRNPLTGIKNASYILKKNYGTKMDEKGNTMLKTIDDCVEYSDKIVKDLLEYSCQIKLEKIKTNTRQLVNDSLSTLAIPSSMHVINEASDEFSVSVDIGKIERVFSNLIKNALDAMPNGGELKITNGQNHNLVEIAFSDTGTGMSQEVLQKLWTPFFTTKAKGMGVGLSICKRIIEAHGGKIKVASAPGKGTIFTVFLPLENS